MNHSIISQSTRDLAKRIQANSDRPLTQRQAIRRAMWCWELERGFLEIQAEMRQEQADTTDQ
jgi:hypothetical protein